MVRRGETVVRRGETVILVIGSSFSHHIFADRRNDFYTQ